MGTQDEQTALKGFVIRCTVPLAIEDGANQGVQGTGTFFRLGGNPYFVTARHVVDNIDFDKVGIPTAPTALVLRHTADGNPLLLKRAKIQTFGQAILTTPEDSRHDVAVVLLKDEAFVGACEQAWTFLTAANLLGLGDRVAHYIVCGFPVACRRETGDSPFFPPLAIRTQSIPPPQDGIAWDSPVDPVTDLFLAYDKKVRRSGEIVDSPELPGISGSAVWAVLKDKQGGLWTPETQLKVAGIQVGYCHSRCIRVKKLVLLAALFGKIDAAAADEIRAVVGGSA